MLSVLGGESNCRKCSKEYRQNRCWSLWTHTLWCGGLWKHCRHGEFADASNSPDVQSRFFTSGDSGDSWASGPAILWTLAPIQVHTIRVKDAFVLGSQLLPKQTVINWPLTTVNFHMLTNLGRNRGQSFETWIVRLCVMSSAKPSANNEGTTATWGWLVMLLKQTTVKKSPDPRHVAALSCETSHRYASHQISSFLPPEDQVCRGYDNRSQIGRCYQVLLNWCTNVPFQSLSTGAGVRHDIQTRLTHFFVNRAPET